MTLRTKLLALTGAAAAVAGTAVLATGSPAGAAQTYSLKVCDTAFASPSTAVVDFHGTRYGPRTVSAADYSCSSFRALPAGLPYTVLFQAPGRAMRSWEKTMEAGGNYIVQVYGDPADPQVSVSVV